MLLLLWTLGLILLAPAPDHGDNPVFAAILEKEIAIGSERFRLPEPTFRDEQSADEQRAALQELAGTDRGVEAFLRDSVTAPFQLKLQDLRDDQATLRVGSLYFVLHVDLEAIDPSQPARTDKGKFGPVEAGNMQFHGRVLEADDFQESPVEIAAGSDEWYLHSEGRLLDRIVVETTDRLTASRTEDSIVLASMTDDRWPDNRWATLPRGRDETPGDWQPYVGGIGYTKFTRLKGVEGAVIVEAHFAFVEPRAWFDGAPILRSKFSLIAQDQIRRLRRELASGS
ncbi:hypothetical protein BH23PLA1_BH23PLA1_13310 [soil metagenome]